MVTPTNRSTSCVFDESEEEREQRIYRSLSFELRNQYLATYVEYDKLQVDLMFLAVSDCPNCHYGLPKVLLLISDHLRASYELLSLSSLMHMVCRSTR